MNHLILYKEPWKKYPHAKCHDCDDGIYVFNTSHSAIGSGSVETLVWFDRQNHRLVPLFCKLDGSD